MITFRLADALPQDKLAEFRENPMKPLDGNARRRLVEEYLDAGIGNFYLRDSHIARLTERAQQYADGEKYHLYAWVVMPNHVHVLVEVLPISSLSEIMHSWKSFTAKEANRYYRRSGRFWQAEYFDRAIRDEQHWRDAVEYIHNNPVKAGLVQIAEEWPFSDASREYQRILAGETPALPAKGALASSRDTSSNHTPKTRNSY